MSDANRLIASRFNVPDAFWHGLTLIGLEPAMVLRQARLPVTLGIRELRDRRQVSTQEFFRLWEAVHVLNPDPAAGILLVTRLDIAILPPSSFAAFIARDYRDGLPAWPGSSNCVPPNACASAKRDATARSPSTGCTPRNNRPHCWSTRRLPHLSNWGAGARGCTSLRSGWSWPDLMMAAAHWPTFSVARSILVPGAMPWCSTLPTWIDPSRAITRNCWRCSTRRSLQRWPRPRHLPAWPCK